MSEFLQISCTCGVVLTIKLDAPWDETRIIEVEPCEDCIERARDSYSCGHQRTESTYCKICA